MRRLLATITLIALLGGPAGAGGFIGDGFVPSSGGGSGGGIQSVTTTGATLSGAGTGASPLAVVPGAVLDALSAVNGTILTRTAGTWAAIANVATANGALLLTAQSAPAAPSSGTAQVYTTTTNGRVDLAVLGPTGAQQEFQPLIGRKRTMTWQPLAGAVTTFVWGFEALRVTGTATLRTPASTRFATSLVRLGAVSAAGAGSAAGFRGAAGALWLGNGAGLGGFLFIGRFMISDASLVTTANMFVGLQSATGAPTDVAPSTLTNLIGVGCDNGDTNLQLYASGAAAQARTSLGSNFPVNGTPTTDVYELMLWAQPNATSVSYRVTRLNTGDVATGSLSGANIPTNTTFLTPNWYRSNGGTATAVSLDLVNAYAETDN